MGADHHRRHLRGRERQHHQHHGLRTYSLTHGLRINNYLFAQENIVWKRISVLAGLAWVHNASFGNRAVPRVSGSFLVWNGNTILSGTRLRAAYAEGIKEPSFEQSFGIGGTFPTLPNPNLKPEENYAVEAGFDQSLFGDRLSLTRDLLPQLLSRSD